VTTRIVVRARTPPRTSFAGGRNDIPPFPETERGAVLSATIDRCVLGSLATPAHSHLSIESRNYGIGLKLAPADGFAPAGNLNLLKAPLRRVWVQEDHGYGAILSSSARPGSGLGSSSAMVVTVVGFAKRIVRVSDRRVGDGARRDCYRARRHAHRWPMTHKLAIISFAKRTAIPRMPK
jgi:D-glycero-alpha-D-manno-heptose-7-phosphate kinase